MKLEVHERLVLPTLLPREGDYAALKTIRRAKEMVAFSPDEIKFYEIREVRKPDGTAQTVWNPARAQEQIKDCPVDEYTTDLVRSKLAEMNRLGKLTDEFMSLYEKFVVMYT